MKKFAIVAVLIAMTAGLAGCLEIDLSRTNGNQKADEPATTDTVE